MPLYKWSPTGEKMLDKDFIMNIFSPLYEELPELKELITYFFEEKELNVLGSYSCSDCVLAIILPCVRSSTQHDNKRINRQMNSV
jgi:hypothetical protein